MSSKGKPDAGGLLRQAIGLTYLLPFAATVWFVAKYGVDAPFMDGWGLSHVFYNVAGGGPVVPLLLQCNNEHPTLFPKLIFIALAFASKGNVCADMAMTLLAALAMLVAISRIAAAEPAKVDRATALSVFVASLLVFSFVHYDEWLWGWELTFVLTNTFAVLAVYFVCAPTRHPLRGQILAWTCCVIASSSALFGFVSWLALIPAQVARFENKARAYLAVAGSALLLSASIAAYLLVLTRPFVYPVNRSFWHKHPLAASEFLCALVGAPLAQGNLVPPAKLAPLLGAALITLFAFCVASLARAGRLSPAAPWISIGLFGLGSAAMTALGRSAWGVGVAASQSRYMNASVLLAVAVLELCRRLMGERRALFIAFASIIGALSIAGSVASIPIARRLKRERTRAAAYLEVERFIDPATDKYAQSCLFPLFPVTPYTGWVRPGAEMLDALGFRKIVRHVPFIENPSRPYGMFELSEKDGRTPTLRDGDTVEAHGWATIPDDNGFSPRFVLISVGDARVFVAAAWVKRRKPRPGLDPTVQSRWSMKIPAIFLPPGELVLKAWVYDAEQEEFVRLGSLGSRDRVYKQP